MVSLSVFVQGVPWTSRPMVAEISSSYPNSDKDKQKNMHWCIPLLFFTILEKSVIQVLKFNSSVKRHVFYQKKKKSRKKKKKSILNNKTWNIAVLSQIFLSVTSVNVVNMHILTQTSVSSWSNFGCPNLTKRQMKAKLNRKWTHSSTKYKSQRSSKWLSLVIYVSIFQIQ